MSAKRTISRVQLINMVARENMMRAKDVEKVMDALVQNITFALHKGNRVKIVGLGTFEMQHRSARTGRNPHTGEAVPIPPRDLPVFKPDERLKKSTQGGV